MKHPWIFCLALLVGLGKESGPSVGLAGGGVPDFKAYDQLLQNISQHRESGKNVSISASFY